MKKIQCECGHVNPEGTELCQSCGRPLTNETQSTKLLDMRYEGSARRSKTYNKSLVDKIWNFFSSVKVGIWFIILTLIASAIGTIFPQEMYVPVTSPLQVEEYYQEEYGTAGLIYYRLGLNNLYSSWWYILLVAGLAVSIIVASIDRFFPLYRSLKNQRVVRHESFMSKQRLYSESEDIQLDTNDLEEKMKKKGYKVRQDEKGNLLAEKGRFARWGPYVNHIGLIIFLFGGLLRLVPGMYIDEKLWIRDGETLPIPGTDREYYLESKRFIMEVYDEDDDEVFEEALNRVGSVAKNFQTDVVLYKQPTGLLPGEKGELEFIKEEDIQVNEPLKFDGFALYQTSYQLDEFKAMSFTLDSKDGDNRFGPFKVDLFNPDDEYKLDTNVKVELMGYYPDFSEFAENGEPQSKSSLPLNPAFLFKMYTPEHPEGEVSFVGIQQNLEPLGENDYKLSFAGLETQNVSILTVRKDLTLWVLALGGFIFMVGVAQGAYWNHRRIWIQQKNNKVLLAAHVNKKLA